MRSPVIPLSKQVQAYWEEIKARLSVLME